MIFGVGIKIIIPLLIKFLIPSVIKSIKKKKKET